jgi:hypothetical protein
MYLVHSRVRICLRAEYAAEHASLLHFPLRGLALLSRSVGNEVTQWQLTHRFCVYVHESCCPGNQRHPPTYVGCRRFWCGPLTKYDS